jgi:tRNA 2-selenouridine synthase
MNDSLTIQLLINNLNDYIIVDVRSPSEYLKGHIPSSINIPLFSDEERKIIGTIYKQEGKRAAIEQGFNLVNLPSLVKKFKSFPNKPLVIYCARGGMRSASVGWLLALLDYNISILKGGYKNFRNWVIDQFKKPYKLKIIGGNTCVGKTDIIKLSSNSIDLEELANHRGSVFGGFDKKQPTQEHFENLLALSLFSCNKEWIFVEDESRFIGNLRIPTDFYDQMKTSPIIVLQEDLKTRIVRCLKEYQNYKKEDLKNGVKKIEKKLGRMTAQQVSSFIDDERYRECCEILFSYYDKSYNYSLTQRAPKKVFYLNIKDKTNEEIISSFSSQEIEQC